jgi:hypothetical protein
MNIFEISDKAKISVKKLRLLDKLGVLRHDASTTELDAIRATLKTGNRLNVGQLVQLIENPGGLLELGKYASKASAQLAELDNPKGQVAPREISAQILEAFEKQPDAVAALVGWCKSIIPAHPVGHAYIATRLLLGVPENVRHFDVPRLQRVMMNCRDHPEFAGWWKQEKSVSSRNRTIYQKLALDL